MSGEREFQVHDYVVYPTHGVGEIVDIETQLVGGMEIQVFVISFLKEKMILRVPVKRAKASGLRHISSEVEMQKMVRVLQGRAKIDRGVMWSRRAQQYEAKINSGDIMSIAEVVRDLHRNSVDPDRPYSERLIYESALGRLVGEYAVVHKIEVTQANIVLTDLLREREEAA